jgi:hypothetical protein
VSFLAILDPRIFDDPTCKRAEYKTLWALGHRAQWKDPQWRGWCWPSLKQLAEDTGFSHPTVIKALKRLETGGYVRVVRSRKPDGSPAPNRYYVIHDDPRAHMAQPDRLTPTYAGSQESLPTPEAVKESEQGDVLKELVGGSQAAHGEGVYNGTKAPHGVGLSHNTKETNLEGEHRPAAGAAGGESRAVVVGTINGNGRHAVAVRGREAVIERGRTAFAEVMALTQRHAAAADLREQMVTFAFAYWQAKHNHPDALQDTKREAVLRTRLKENHNDLSELLFAADGARKDRNLMGENERGRKYDGIETIYRDRAQVERLATLGGYKRGIIHPQVAAMQEAN